MTEEEKPKKRKIEILIEEEGTTVEIQVIPDYGKTVTLIQDLSLVIGHVLGNAAKDLNGIKHLMDSIGEKALRAAFSIYEQREGKDATLLEVLMSLVDSKRAIMSPPLDPKDLPEPIKAIMDKKCKACEKLECPLAGKGITAETKKVPECLN